MYATKKSNSHITRTTPPTISPQLGGNPPQLHPHPSSQRETRPWKRPLDPNMGPATPTKATTARWAGHGLPFPRHRVAPVALWGRHGAQRTMGKGDAHGAEMAEGAQLYITKAQRIAWMKAHKGVVRYIAATSSRATRDGVPVGAGHGQGQADAQGPKVGSPPFSEPV